MPGSISTSAAESERRPNRQTRGRGRAAKGKLVLVSDGPPTLDPKAAAVLLELVIAYARRHGITADEPGP